MSSHPVFLSAAAWICLIIPAIYLAGALLASRAWRRPAPAWGLASGLSVAAVLAAVAFAGFVATSSGAGSVADPLARFLGASLAGERLLSVRTDSLTCVMLLLVTFIGWVVVRFSRRYLDGDPQQLDYLRRLLLTLAAVSGLVSSNNLLVIALLWLGASLSLHGLLTHFAERTAAQIAAHKKFLLSRLADACLLGAIGLTASSLGTLELDRIFDIVQRAPGLAPSTALGCVLIAVSVLLKCAQLPFHGWLIQVMEAPTPVSALLHAGVVNIGGFLLIRLAPLMTHAHVAQSALLVFGLATASAASVVMLTRISVKVMLAWSTCAQMGLMLVECALGAYEMALLHLVAHSLYKAHAFLSAGSAVAAQRTAAMAPPVRRPGLGVLLAAGAASLTTLTVVLVLRGVDVVGQPAHWFPIALLGLALPSLLLSLPAQPRGRVLVTLAGAGLAVAACFAVGHVAFEKLLPSGPELAASGSASAFAVACLLGHFVVHAWLRQRPESALAQWLYPRAFAGFHLDELFTRFTFRLWPAKLPVSSPVPLALSHSHGSTSP
jgi:NAD(P)H-quinone oxidoreductase subunit 5